MNDTTSQPQPGGRAPVGDPTAGFGPQLRALVKFLCAQAGLAERLRAKHVDDGTGHCAVCPVGGQAGRYRWPCRLDVAVEAALLVEQSPPHRAAP